MKSTPLRRGLRITLVATAVGISFGLAGCVQSNAQLPGGASTAKTPASAPSTASPTTGGSPSPVASAPPGGTKFAENCSILLSAAQVYAYNPNYVADAAYTPKAGTIPAQIAAKLGQTCGWINETSSAELAIGIAAPGASALAAAKSAAATGTPISASGENGYFAVVGGVGSAQFFFGSLWMDVSSSEFTTAADAQPVYSVVIKNQLAAGG
jgi:hypothetical protein